MSPRPSLAQRLIALEDVRPLPANPYPPDRLWPFIWHFISQIKWILGIAYGLSFISSATQMLGPLMLRHIVDTLLTIPDKTQAWLALRWPLALYFLFVLVISLGAYVAMSFVRATTYNSGLTHAIRRQLHWVLLQQSWTFFQNDFAGRLANKIMEVGSEIRNIINAMRRVMWVIVGFTTAAITLAWVNILLVVPLLIWGFAYMIMLFLMVPEIRRLAMIFSDTRSLCVGRMVDSYTNIQTVKLFAGVARENQDLVSVMHDARLKHADVQLGNFKLDVGVLILEAFLLASLLLLALWLWQNGEVSAGTIAMVIPAALLLVTQAATMREEFGGFLESLGTIEDGMQALIHPIGVQDAPRAKPLKMGKGAIAFKDMTFAYSANQPPVFAKLGLKIPAGQKVGLVGPSGAGKSTLVNLLLRFFDVTGGSITIDGQDVRKVSQDSLRSHIGVVTQDTSLLHRSIAENIQYGKPGATIGEVIAAAKKAHAHEFIEKLVDKDGRTGYAAQVGERGVKLSGGQRQRIAIARLVLKDAPILVLDEATSALDSEVEQAIQENLGQLMQGKTVIAIAHRLSTIAKLDRLIILENGRIVEDGSHAQLLKKKGLYARLWAHQSGGFLPEED